MPSVKPHPKALVTGANGFIATWIVQVLIDRGYTVVGTVRSVSKGTFMKQKFGDQFEFAVVGDLEMDAFDEVVESVNPDAIFHTASPVSLDASIDPEIMIGQAIHGTLGILQSAQRFGSNVKRVVITSSVATIFEPKDDPSYTFTEKDWNTQPEQILEREGKNTPGDQRYQVSKRRAEQAAWEFIYENGSDSHFDITTILPSLVFGPVLQEVNDVSSLNGSTALFRYGIFNNFFPKSIPSIFVDVRDVALAHVLALETPEAGGERIIVSNQHFSWPQLTDELIQAGHNVTPLEAPQDTIASSVSFENSRSKKILGLNYRTIQETAVDTYAELKKRFPESFP